MSWRLSYQQAIGALPQPHGRLRNRTRLQMGVKLPSTGPCLSSGTPSHPAKPPIDPLKALKAVPDKHAHLQGGVELQEVVLLLHREPPGHPLTPP